MPRTTAPQEPVLRQEKQARRHGRVVRVSAFSIATVLALLATTATLPPLLADQSDRAVINAPISLLTAPIAGEVRALHVRVGEPLAPGATVAEIHNGRIDRTTLITLDSKADELRTALLAARQKRESDESYIAALDGEIRKQGDQMIARLVGEVSEARARVAAANAESLSTSAVVDRQQSMVERNTASIDLLRPTQQKLEAARYGKDVEAAKLDQKLSQLDAVRKGVYVGNEFNSLAVLVQKRRDLAVDAKRLSIEATQLASGLERQEALLGGERTRLVSLTDAAMTASNGGVVLSLGVTSGRHVSPGDSVATLVDCDQSFAVGIFSYRQAQDLAVGTPVRIAATGTSIPLRGWVSEVLPKTSSKTDEQYAVPFPQTERREMFVLVSLDRASLPSSEPATAAAVRTSPCSVGQWVTITRENGWLPSTSVAWKTIGSGLQSAAIGTGDFFVRTARSPEAEQAWRSVANGAARTADAVSEGIAAVAAHIAAAWPQTPAQAAQPDSVQQEPARPQETRRTGRQAGNVR